MNTSRFPVIGWLIMAAGALSLSPVNAQQMTPAATAAPPLVQTMAKPRARTQQAAIHPPSLSAEKCLRALNGACVNAAVVEETRLRAIVIPQVQVSYLGTPAGTIGGPFIPFERLFQDNQTKFGLPTNVLVQTCCVTRTK